MVLIVLSVCAVFPLNVKNILYIYIDKNQNVGQGTETVEIISDLNAETECLPFRSFCGLFWL